MLVGDPLLTSHLTDSDNPYMISSLKTLKKLIKKYQLEGRAEILKWFACDPEFLPSKHDMRFKEWTANGLTTYSTLLKKSTMLSFQDIKHRYNLQNQDYFRYFQIRDFIRNVLIFLNFFKSDTTIGDEISRSWREYSWKNLT